MILTPLALGYVLCVPLCLLPRRWSLPFQFVAAVVIGLVCFVDLYCQEFFGTAINPHIVGMMWLTDGREFGEFISTFLHANILIRWRVMLLTACLVLQVRLFFIQKYPFKLLAQWESFATHAALTAGLFLLFSAVASSQIRYFSILLSKANPQQMEGSLFQEKGAYSPVHRLVLSVHAVNQSENTLSRIRQATLKAWPDSCSHIVPHILWIIGESYNKHHSQLYGYPYPTTPLQLERKNRGELAVFTDVVTPWNITSNVLTSAFSMWHEGCNGRVEDYPLFPLILRRVGYRVSFLSNQYFLSGLRRQLNNLSGGFFLADSELSDSLFDFRNQAPSTFDMGLIRQFREYRDSAGYEGYTFDIIHLIGQHFKYASRFPRESRWFKPTDYDRKDLNLSQRQILADYDNATRYNDEVIDSLLSLMEKEDAIVIYMADHGEEIYDDLPIRGRLFGTPDERAAHQEFEVPFWIWCSPGFRQLRPNLVSEIGAAVQRPFMTDDIANLFLQLLGVHCRWRHGDQLFKLEPNGKRFIFGSVDYDSF